MNESLHGFAEKYADLISFNQPGQKLYFIGGVVRDLCIGRAHNDIDLLVQGDTRDIARKFANHLNGAFFMLDEERNTARVVVNNEAGHLIFDFAKLQGETIEADLCLRDFTINAMAIDFDQLDTIIDPLGGQQDLKEKRLRICSPTSFSRDPVRVIRAVRYSIACNVKIEPETLVLLKESISGLKNVSWERKRDELFKILDTPKPALGLELLSRLGVLAEMFGQPYPALHCHFDQVAALQHLFEMIDGRNSGEANKDLFEASCNLRLGRFYPSLAEHYFPKNQSERNIKQICLLSSCLGGLTQGDQSKILSVLLLSREEGSRISTLNNENGRLVKTLAAKEILGREKYLYFKEIGAIGLDLIFLDLASKLAAPASELHQDMWLEHLQKCEVLIAAWYQEQALVNPVLFLNGKDLMMEFDLTPGPKIGLLLEKMREEQAAGKINSRQDAMDWVEQQLPNLEFQE
ncbi:MAG: hypothetical protein VB013_07560 [Anaerolineaceae bacterium]|nr:hypothetical protein [Anaerolineaceae bacterium]